MEKPIFKVAELTHPATFAGWYWLPQGSEDFVGPFETGEEAAADAFKIQGVEILGQWAEELGMSRVVDLEIVTAAGKMVIERVTVDGEDDVRRLIRIAKAAGAKRVTAQPPEGEIMEAKDRFGHPSDRRAARTAAQARETYGGLPDDT
jgi:hypothetical protein